MAKNSRFLGRMINMLCLSYLLLFIIGCKRTENPTTVEPVELTKSVNKIETAYHEGAIKTENSSDPKFNEEETIAPISIQEAVKRRLLEYQKAFDNRYRSTRIQNAAIPVGVIPAVDACPAGSEKIKFYMDNQDNGNSSKTGWTGAWSLDGNGNSWHTICSVNGYAFRFMTLNTSTKYLLVRLGNYKTAFMEPRVWNVYFDNEDSNNKNIISEGNFGPNSQNKNGTTLQFWAIAGKSTPGDSQDSAFPDFGFSYGVFGTFSSPVVGGAGGTGSFYTDDENNNNANQLFSVDWSTNVSTNAASVEGKGVDRTNDPGNTTFNIRKVR